MTRDLSVGERIRTYREDRGLTQAQLAHLVGRSVHWLYLIERGQRQPTRYSDLLAIARVLQVTVADLSGRQEAARPERGQDPLGKLRSVLAVPDTLSAPDGDEIELSDLRADVEQLDRLAWASRLDEAAPLLPSLVERARSAIVQLGGDDRLAAYALLAQVYRGVSAVCKRHGDLGQARVAVERSWWAAERSQDRTIRGLAARVVAVFLLQEGESAESSHVATRAVTDLGAPASEPDLAVWGSLVLAAAIAEARRGNGPAAGELLAEAEAGARGVHDNHRNWTTFGPTNVSIHRMSAAVDLGEPGPVLQVAERVPIDTLPPELAERRARYWIDLARAHAMRGHGDAMVETLLRADRAMPGELRRHVAVRELIRQGLRWQRRRSNDSDLARLARRVGVLSPSR